MERSYLILASVVRGGAYKLEADFPLALKSLARPTCKSVRATKGFHWYFMAYDLLYR